MDTISQSRMEAGRFASYVEELRDFARSYHMQVGSSEGVHTLRKALDGPGPFREECASMIRSVVYRERGKANPEDLLALVTTAWGGPEVHGELPSLQEALSAITIFLAGVMRVQRDGRSSPVKAISPGELQEPAVSYGYVPSERAGIFAAATQTAEAEHLEGRVPPGLVEKEEVEARDGLDSTLKELEAESPDVQLYLQLLKQRTTKQADGSTFNLVVLDERPAKPSPLDPTAAKRREDPWNENSELQRELRRFAAEREAIAAEHRAAKAARAPHIKFLFVVEGMLYRIMGSDNMVRRYLSEHLKPHNLED